MRMAICLLLLWGWVIGISDVAGARMGLNTLFFKMCSGLDRKS